MAVKKEPETPVANTQTPTLESLEDFFAQAETGSVKVFISDAQSRASVNDIIMGSVVKVSAAYPSSKPEGTYVFYVRPSTGGYKNAMIFKGNHGGSNEISGTYASFYIPNIGQMSGSVDFFVYIPGHGVGKTSAVIKYAED